MAKAERFTRVDNILAQEQELLGEAMIEDLEAFERADTPLVGQRVETPTLDGRKTTSVIVAEKSDTQILARHGDSRARLAEKKPAEVSAERRADNMHNLLDQTVDDALNSVIKLLNLSEKEARLLKNDTELNKAAILLDVAGADNPDAKIVDIVQNRAESGTDFNYAKLTLPELHFELRMAKDSAKKNENSPKYKQAMQRVRETELAILSRRAELNPNISESEKAAIADGIEGYNEILPDAIYGNPDALNRRIKELESAMKDADKNKDETAWSLARKEYDAHMSAKPFVEKTIAVIEAKKLAQEMMLSKQAEFEKGVRAQKGRLQGEELGIRFNIQVLKPQIKKFENEMREIENRPTPAFINKTKGPTQAAEYAFTETEWNKKMTRLQEHKKRIKQIRKEFDIYENLNLVIDFEPSQPIDETASDLYRLMRDSYKDDPKSVLRFVNGTLENPNTPASIKSVVEQFKEAQELGLFDEKPPKPILSEPSITQTTAEAGEPKDTSPAVDETATTQEMPVIETPVPSQPVDETATTQEMPAINKPSADTEQRPEPRSKAENIDEPLFTEAPWSWRQSPDDASANSYFDTSWKKEVALEINKETAEELNISVEQLGRFEEYFNTLTDIARAMGKNNSEVKLPQNWQMLQKPELKGVKKLFSKVRGGSQRKRVFDSIISAGKRIEDELYMSEIENHEELLQKIYEAKRKLLNIGIELP